MRKKSNSKKKRKLKARTLTKSTRQTGTSNISKDKRLKAKAPGKRRSRKGKIYYEYRKNRSDVKGRDTPTTRKQKRKSIKKKISKSSKLTLQQKRIKAYKQKIEAKKKRLKALALKTKSASNQAYKQTKRISSMIPFGQPILVGHHSEGRHRRDIKRMDKGMRKSIELSNKAGEYERRLKALENNYAISSDDPEAISKLKKKALMLEKKRELIKDQNKKLRKAGKKGNPTWVLSNLGQNITSVKKRIKFLTEQSKIKPSSKTIKGIRVIKNPDINRLQLEFPGIPKPETRTLLKRSGFRWSPSQGRWQRQLNNSAVYAAKRVLEEL
jgi:hypothetical protein